MPCVVFNAFAVTDFAEHFQVKAGALFDALRFNQLAFADELLDALNQLKLDGLHRHHHLVARGHVMAFRVDHKARDFLADAPGQRVKQLQRLDLIVKQFNAYSQLGMLGRKDVNHIAAYAESAARKVLLIAAVLHADQAGDHIALAHLVADAGNEPHLRVVLGCTYAVDRADGGHDDGVTPLQHALGRRQPHLLDVLVDGGVFFDEEIALRHVGLRLVVVVVTDEILDRVLWKKFAELAVQLGCKGLVRRKNDGRAAQPGNHIGHGESFARTGHAQQGLENFTVIDTFDQLLNCRGLITCRLVGHEQLKGRTRVTHKATGQGRIIRFGQGTEYLRDFLYRHH